ncbi:MAG: hypothetical protein LUD03_06900 [Firmicutes bacterium]|nr:hypothetical protein [Bacillota bacterium]
MKNNAKEAKITTPSEAAQRTFELMKRVNAEHDLYGADEKRMIDEISDCAAGTNMYRERGEGTRKALADYSAWEAWKYMCQKINQATGSAKKIQVAAVRIAILCMPSIREKLDADFERIDEI